VDFGHELDIIVTQQFAQWIKPLAGGWRGLRGCGGLLASRGLFANPLNQLFDVQRRTARFDHAFQSSSIDGRYQAAGVPAGRVGARDFFHGRDNISVSWIRAYYNGTPASK
jgi:hypothetical protein